MKRRNLGAAWLAAMCLLIAPVAALADQPQAAATPVVADEVSWNADVRVRRMFDSYTSYEFGNPDWPYQAPLSRLEFDLDSWWGGVEISRRTALWSASIEVMRNLSKNVDGMLADSDWLIDRHPQMRSVYSESNLDMKPSYTVRAEADVSLARPLGLPAWLDLRPVGGLRWQRFDLMAHDVTQWELRRDGSWISGSYSGDVLRFKQTYWQYFIGLKAALRPLPERYPGLKLSGQVDWAYVKGNNKDHHLLREGNRITEESTTGDAWHAALALEAPLWEHFYLDLQFDYMTIDTSGDHHWYNDDPDWLVDETWSNGVNVWSRQLTLTAALRYNF